MRLNINLASQKYEDVRQFYTRWTAAIAFAAVLTLLLIVLAWMNYSSSSSSGERIRRRQERIATLQKKRDAAGIIINLPENHEISSQKNYWNKQFNRRQLSWTQLFNDLQRIMPARAYLNSVHPEITQDNRLRLTLVVVGDTHENGLELQKKMEKSEHFRGPFINSETPEKDPKSGTPLYKFEIVTYYTPTGQAQARPATREGL
ncbi:MAG TPA: PilN domain-containing protein [Verrucomicrobiae bacterium]|nr:PilN domain-containing protein [Verrucomicrobiae bacterium]